MFDPFGDFATEGYLRNFDKEKDLEIVKIAEHELFRAQFTVARRCSGHKSVPILGK